MLLVTNCFDGVTSQRNKARLIRRFPGLLSEDCFFDFDFVSSKDEGFQLFVQKLVEECLNSQRLLFKDTLKAMELVSNLYQERILLNRQQLALALEEHLAESSRDNIEFLIARLKEFGRLIEIDSQS